MAAVSKGAARRLCGAWELSDAVPRPALPSPLRGGGAAGEAASQSSLRSLGKLEGARNLNHTPGVPPLLRSGGG